MKFIITITKEVIEKSLMCGHEYAATNCAIAVAYGELVPYTYVLTEDIYFKSEHQIIIQSTRITAEQKKFIEAFDAMIDTPQERLSLLGQSFEVEVPDEVIEYWHGDAVTAVQKIVDNPILKAVTA